MVHFYKKFSFSLARRQSETTETDLICVVTSLSALVVTVGAAAFSHYEGESHCQPVVQRSELKVQQHWKAKKIRARRNL